MTLRTDSSPAVAETAMVHNVHRRATALLADATASDVAPSDAVGALRDLVVAMLQHHHGMEDRDLWPMLTAASPPLAAPLADLTREHDRLDAALDRVADGPSPAAAAELRDLVHEHLSHEEPVLFPALLDHVTDDEWKEFSQHVVATVPPVGLDLMMELMHEASHDGEVELVLRHLPPEARAQVPAMRAAAAPTLATLRATGR